MRNLAPLCRGMFVLACLLGVSASLVGQDTKDAPKKVEYAVLIIKCESEAELTIDGVKTRPGKRKFVTPDLEPGKKYYYTVSAFWEPNNYTKITRTWKVYVKPGETTTVDMTKPDPKQPIDDIKVRWVPTPEKVVDAMLKMGKVGKDDVVYDLGCGDARMVIAAVKEGGAKKGVGIDIDPERITESKANVVKEKLEKKVEIKLGDLLDDKVLADVSNATVILIYLGDEFNALLKPKLLKILKPGTRIVSHRFKMGDWKPDESISVTGEDGDEYELHLWTVKKAN